MKKKLLTLAVALVFAISFVSGLSACANSDDSSNLASVTDGSNSASLSNIDQSNSSSVKTENSDSVSVSDSNSQTVEKSVSDGDKSTSSSVSGGDNQTVENSANSGDNSVSDSKNTVESSSSPSTSDSAVDSTKEVEEEKIYTEIIPTSGPQVTEEGWKAALSPYVLSNVTINYTIDYKDLVDDAYSETTKVVIKIDTTKKQLYYQETYTYDGETTVTQCLYVLEGNRYYLYTKDGSDDWERVDSDEDEWENAFDYVVETYLIASTLAGEYSSFKYDSTVSGYVATNVEFSDINYDEFNKMTLKFSNGRIVSLSGSQGDTSQSSSSDDDDSCGYSVSYSVTYSYGSTKIDIPTKFDDYAYEDDEEEDAE